MQSSVSNGFTYHRAWRTLLVSGAVSAGVEWKSEDERRDGPFRGEGLAALKVWVPGGGGEGGDGGEGEGEAGHDGG